MLERRRKCLHDEPGRRHYRHFSGLQESMKPEIADPAIVAAVEFFHRYIDRYLPDKAIDLS